MSLTRVPLNNFRGGLNTRDSPFELMPNETPDCLNVTLTALVGMLQVRAGKTTLSSTAPAAADNMRQIVLGGSTRFLMLSIGGKIYSMDPGGAFTLRFAGTAGTVWDFAQMYDAAGKEWVWCCNGTDAPQKWDGVAGTTSAWGGTPSVTYNRILVWKNKMVLLATATNNTVYFSKTGDPEATTGAFDFVQVRADDDEADFSTDINVLADRLYVFKARSVYLFTDPSTFANRRVGEPGCSGRFQSDVCEDKLYFFNEQGLWSTAGVAVAYESGSINTYFPQHLNVNAISKVRVLATRDTYPRLLVCMPIDGSSTNNIMMETVPHLNFRRIGGRRYLLLPAFLPQTFKCASIANFKPSSTNEWTVVGADLDAPTKIYSYFNGTTDDGTPITAHWKSSWMAIQGEEPFERIRRCNVELSGDAIVDIFKDFNQAPDFSATLPQVAGGTDVIWDNNPHTWDDGGVWDPPSTYRFSRVRPESRGRFHQLQFRTLSGGQPFQINVAEMVYRGGKEH